MLYNIKLVGCDATTEVVKEISSEQLEFLQSLSAEAERKQLYHCYPVIELEEISQARADEIKKEFEEESY